MRNEIEGILDKFENPNEISEKISEHEVALEKLKIAHAQYHKTISETETEEIQDSIDYLNYEEIKFNIKCQRPERPTSIEEIQNDDPEVKKPTKLFVTDAKEERNNLRAAIQKRKLGEPAVFGEPKCIQFDEIKNAEREILKHVQQQSFPSEMHLLSKQEGAELDEEEEEDEEDEDENFKDNS
eukprot:gene9280-10259_t